MGSRIAEGTDWKKGRSVCDACGHTLSPRDLIPVISWILNRGKCRRCGAKIPRICILSEVLLGSYFILCVLRYGISADAFRCMALSGILLGLSVVDLRIYEIPDGFILAGFILWILTVPAAALPWKEEVMQGMLGGVLSGGGMGLTAFLFERIRKEESLGGGDIKLFFMTGLFLKPAGALTALLPACLFGLCFTAVLKQEKIPFGPAISIAVCITMLYGSVIAAWYCRFLL